SPYLDNTDNQDLAIAANVLSISGGATTVDLSGYLDNTDEQDLSLSGTTLNISGGTGVDLSVIQDGTGTDSQAISVASDILSITGSAGTVDLSPYLDNTDSQNLSLAGTTLNISGGTGVDLAAIADGTGTDDQNLTSATLSGNTLTVAIEGGTSVNVDLSPILGALEAENTAQQAQIDDLITRVEAIEACACSGTLGLPGGGDASRDAAILYQNIPNPFNDTSAIRYFVPQSMQGEASIVFVNTAGQIISKVDLDQKGDQELNINTRTLSSGMYYYTLYVGGKKVDTKKMIIE
uniref:T9SS type A sorting domain-containing protein n=1 Tax=Kordia jejudonensis TaxID=1348245 RepID=UPI000629104F